MVINAGLPGFHRVERQAQRARHRTLARPREWITAPDRALYGLVIRRYAARAQQAWCSDLFTSRQQRHFEFGNVLPRPADSRARCKRYGGECSPRPVTRSRAPCRPVRRPDCRQVRQRTKSLPQPSRVRSRPGAASRPPPAPPSFRRRASTAPAANPAQSFSAARSSSVARSFSAARAAVRLSSAARLSAPLSARRYRPCAARVAARPVAASPPAAAWRGTSTGGGGGRPPQSSTATVPAGSVFQRTTKAIAMKSRP